MSSTTTPETTGVKIPRNRGRTGPAQRHSEHQRQAAQMPRLFQRPEEGEAGPLGAEQPGAERTGPPDLDEAGQGGNDQRHADQRGDVVLRQAEFVPEQKRRRDRPYEHGQDVLQPKQRGPPRRQDVIDPHHHRAVRPPPSSRRHAATEAGGVP
jgi:hypothetical protein